MRAGRSAIAPIRQWDASRWPVRSAAEIADFDPGALLDDRKLHKLIRRTDVFGLYAAGQAIEAAGLARLPRRARSGGRRAVQRRDRRLRRLGGGGYQNQYDFFPLLTAADGQPAGLRPRARRHREPDVAAAVAAEQRPVPRRHPARVEGPERLHHQPQRERRAGDHRGGAGAARPASATAPSRSGHDASIEPQMVLYYHGVGLLTADALRPFDAGRSGSVLGEGAAALVLETERAAAARGAAVLGEILGSGCASEGEGLLAIRADGDGLARAIALALDDAGLRAADVGMIVAHGNGTRQADASEARALRAIFGAAAAARHRVQVGVRAPPRRVGNHRDGAGARGVARADGSGHRDPAAARPGVRRAAGVGRRRRRRAATWRSSCPAASAAPTPRSPSAPPPADGA